VRRLFIVSVLGFFLGCGGEGGDVNSSGGSCPTCSSTPSIVTSACSNERKLASAPTTTTADEQRLLGGTPTTTTPDEQRLLASAPTKGGSGRGGTPTTTTTTTTTGGTPFSAPVVNVNTPPSSSVSINCVGGATTP
jgi:hypothetical protein